MKAAPKKGTIPRGTYDTTITGVSIIQRKDDKKHSLRVLARTVGQGKDLVIWRGTATTAAKLEPEAERLQRVMLAGEVVPVKVWHNAKQGQQTAFASVSSRNGNGHAVVVDEKAEAATAAHAAHEKVLQGLSAARLGLTVAAEGCYELRESKGWRALGFETVNEYIASSEVTLGRSEFFAMAAIWEAYVLTGGVEPAMLRDAARSKLEIPLLALGKEIVTPEQALADATSMPRADLRIHYAGLVGGDEAEQEAERKESRRRDIEVTDEMVDRGARAAVEWIEREPLTDGVGLARVVLRAALEREQ